jgi:hypothetical protein
MIKYQPLRVCDRTTNRSLSYMKIHRNCDYFMISLAANVGTLGKQFYVCYAVVSLIQD